MPLTEVLQAALPVDATVEVGWQLDRQHWGQGLAPEGAAACLADGFGRLALARIVAFTYSGNLPSQRVMQKLDMRPVGPFVHPGLPKGHRLGPHVCYAIEAER